MKRVPQYKDVNVQGVWYPEIWKGYGIGMAMDKSKTADRSAPSGADNSGILTFLASGTVTIERDGRIDARLVVYYPFKKKAGCVARLRIPRMWLAQTGHLSYINSLRWLYCAYVSNVIAQQGAGLPRRDLLQR